MCLEIYCLEMCLEMYCPVLENVCIVLFFILLLLVYLWNSPVSRMFYIPGLSCNFFRLLAFFFFFSFQRDFLHHDRSLDTWIARPLKWLSAELGIWPHAVSSLWLSSCRFQNRLRRVIHWPYSGQKPYCAQGDTVLIPESTHRLRDNDRSKKIYITAIYVGVFCLCSSLGAL